MIRTNVWTGLKQQRKVEAKKIMYWWLKGKKIMRWKCVGPCFSCSFFFARDLDTCACDCVLYLNACLSVSVFRLYSHVYIVIRFVFFIFLYFIFFPCSSSLFFLLRTWQYLQTKYYIILYCSFSSSWSIDEIRFDTNASVRFGSFFCCCLFFPSSGDQKKKLRVWPPFGIRVKFK